MRALAILLPLLASAPCMALDAVAVLGCPREDGAVTRLSAVLVERLMARERAVPDARTVEVDAVVRVMRGERLRGGEELAAARVLKLGSHLEASRLVSATYRLEAERCVVRRRFYETLTGSLERCDTLELPCDTDAARLEAAVVDPAPASVTNPVAASSGAPPRSGLGDAPLVLDGCRFGETGAHCRGRLRSRKGGDFRLLLDGSRFAYDNGLRGPLSGWSVDGRSGPIRLEPDSSASLEFDIGISLIHSGPREFHYFLLRYRVGDELWEWSGNPPALKEY